MKTVVIFALSGFALQHLRATKECDVDDPWSPNRTETFAKEGMRYERKESKTASSADARSTAGGTGAIAVEAFERIGQGEPVLARAVSQIRLDRSGCFRRGDRRRSIDAVGGARPLPANALLERWSDINRRRVAFGSHITDPHSQKNTRKDVCRRVSRSQRSFRPSVHSQTTQCSAPCAREQQLQPKSLMFRASAVYWRNRR